LINPATAWTDMHSADPRWLVEFEVDAIIPGLGRVSWIFADWVAEPDLDRGDVNGASVDVVAFVGAHGHCAEALSLLKARSVVLRSL
jgi:hypothetical protein